MFGIKNMFRTIQLNRFQARYSSGLKYVFTPQPASSLLPPLRMKMVSSSNLQSAKLTGACEKGVMAKSMSWRRMISNSNFRNDCHQKAGYRILAAYYNSPDDHDQIGVSCLDRDGTTLDKFTLPGLRLTEDDNPCGFGLVNSCLELVCIDSNVQIFILNPTTKELVVIPKEKPKHDDEFQMVALGYVPSIKKYKVILFKDLECHVFTLGVDSKWRKAQTTPSNMHNQDTVCINMYNHQTAFVNGAIYILETPLYGKRIISLYRFDLENEVWSSIPNPPIEFSKGFLESICELGGKLCIVQKIWGDVTVFNIWMLKDCNKNLWVKEYELKMPDGFCCYPLVMEEDKRILVRVVTCSKDRLCYFDINGNICGEIKIPDHGLITTYVESSFSIN